MRQAITLLVVLLARPDQLLADIPCYVPPSTTHDPYSYLTAFIAASTRLQKACELVFQNPEAAEALSSAMKSSPDWQGPVTLNIYRLKQAKSELRCANTTLQPYSLSSQPMIKASAAIALRAIADLADAADKEVAVSKGLLDDSDAVLAGRTPQLSTAKIAETMSNIGVQEDSAWEALTKATEGALYSLVDQAALKNKAPESQRRFVITASQRRQLLATIENAFGP